MATKKITENTDFTITPKTKNTTYEITATDVLVQFDAGFTDSKGKAIIGYKTPYYNFAQKNNNDLVLTTLFTKDSGKAKTVTTTIKNYFKDTTANYYLNYKTFKKYNDSEATWIDTTIQPDSVAGYDYLYSPTSVLSNQKTYYVATKERTEFSLNGGNPTNIFSPKFNNKFTTNHTKDSTIPDYIYDLSGTDEYTVNKGKMYTYDYAGKDTYTVADEGASAFLTSTDYAGNDTYELGLGSDFWTKDFKGNDTYKVTNNKNNLEDIPRINDDTGNDKYYLEYATVDIVDQGGKDRYEASNAKLLAISDYGKGNDTVIVENSNLVYDKSYIANATGNETYKFTNVSFDWATHTETSLPAIHDESGKDKYTLTDSSNLDIKDEKGNDTYKINDSEHIFITDEAGNDKYTLTENEGGIETDDINITDNGGKDTYIITGTDDDRAGCGKITDSGKSKDKYKFTYCYGSNSLWVNVIDDGGKDSYTIANSYNVDICDNGGKDSYTIANSYDIDIYDNGKEADKYTVTQSQGWLQDEGGNDTYNISESNMNILDDDGNDTYKINKLIKSNDKCVLIDDDGGKDSLTLGVKKSDLVFMTDYEYDVEDERWKTVYNSLIIYDKTNKGLVRIADFYSENGEGTVYSGYGEGIIETIKAGKTTLKNIPDADYFNNVAQDVTFFIGHNTGFSSVMDVLQIGDANDINKLIGYFEGTLPT